MSSITYQVTVNDLAKVWQFNGKLHREDGPAIEGANGSKVWYRDGKLHREDGPAIEHSNGDKIWFLNGRFHRTEGPAIEYVSGDKIWYLNGDEVSEEQHRAQTQPAVELTIAEIEKLLGKRIKVVK